jgi:hypothetical protein
MFNLQHVEGALERYARVRDDDVVSALAELEAAALLSAPQLHLRFRSPSGTRGQDYEGTVVSSWGRIVPWEAKSKVPSSALNAETIWRTLEEARRQLPKGRLGIILVRLPDEGAEAGDVKEISSEAVKRLFRQTRRVAAVIAFWRVWSKLDQAEEGDVVSAPVSRVHVNPELGESDSDIRDVVAAVGRRFNTDWIQLQHLVLDALPSGQAESARAFYGRVASSVQKL